MKHYWVGENLRFVKSNESYGVQLADNLSSIVGNLISKVVPLAGDADLSNKISEDMNWNREKLSQIFQSHFESIKIVTSMREQAMLKTYTESHNHDLLIFKEQMMFYLESRFDVEMRNHISIESAFELMKR